MLKQRRERRYKQELQVIARSASRGDHSLEYTDLLTFLPMAAEEVGRLGITACARSRICRVDLDSDLVIATRDQPMWHERAKKCIGLLRFVSYELVNIGRAQHQLGVRSFYVAIALQRLAILL